MAKRQHRTVHVDRPKGARPLNLREGRRDWYRITNHATGTAEIWIYDEIGYWGVTAADFVAALAMVDATDITVHINSPGGDVFDGIAIYTALQNHPATITVKIDGLAASAASFIAQAGDTITMARQAQMMIHDASGLCLGNAADMQAMADMLERISESIASIYHDRAGGGVKTWRKAMLAETWYSAEEAVTARLADDVAPLPAKEQDDALAAVARWDLTVFSYAGRDKAPGPAQLLVNGGVVPAGLLVLEPDDHELVIPAPTPDPVPDEPVVEPDASWAWDPGAFRTAAAAAAELPFDPREFRDAMAAVAHDAPAPPAPRPRPAGAPDHEPTPEPGPVDDGPRFDSDTFRAALALVANTSPAPTASPPTPAPDAEPDFTIDRSAFERALREAKL
jgi:ATP-dependent protease ClpP protease subunit